MDTSNQTVKSKRNQGSAEHFIVMNGSTSQEKPTAVSKVCGTTRSHRVHEFYSPAFHKLLLEPVLSWTYCPTNTCFCGIQYHSPKQKGWDEMITSLLEASGKIDYVYLESNCGTSQASWTLLSVFPNREGRQNLFVLNFWASREV